MHSLIPAQQHAFDELVGLVRPGRVVTLVARPGTGKTTLLRALQERFGGRRLGTGDIQAAAAGRHPLAIEDALHDLVAEALAENEIVLVDDLDLVTRVVEGCHMYPRGGFLRVAMTALAERAAANGRTIVVAVSNLTPAVFELGGQVTVGELETADYAAICAAYLPKSLTGAMDFAKIRRFARHLNARQLRRACDGARADLEAVGAEGATDTFIEYLRRAQLVSNVDLGEVQAVKLEDLKGIDEVPASSF